MDISSEKPKDEKFVLQRELVHFRDFFLGIGVKRKKIKDVGS
jgi:hypothetical protein